MLNVKNTKIIKISAYKRIKKIKRRKMWVTENKEKILIFIFIAGLLFLICLYKFEQISIIKNFNWTNYNQNYPYSKFNIAVP
jgi:hypothetical protein